MSPDSVFHNVFLWCFCGNCFNLIVQLTAHLPVVPCATSGRGSGCLLVAGVRASWPITQRSAREIIPLSLTITQRSAREIIPLSLTIT